LVISLKWKRICLRSIAKRLQLIPTPILFNLINSDRKPQAVSLALS